jgi:preprotein translocase subunit YajC
MPSGLYTLLMVVAIGLLFYVMLIRPVRRQQAKQAELVSSIQVGSRVMLGSGIFGTVRHLGTKQAVIELAPGVEITVVKEAMSRPLNPDEEEFEYADDDSSQDVSDANESADEEVYSEQEQSDESEPSTGPASLESSWGSVTTADEENRG